MMASLDHGHPILNGYNGYWPKEFRARMNLAQTMPDSDSLDQLREETSLRWILVEMNLLPPAKKFRWNRLLEDGGGAGLRLAIYEPPRALFEVIDQAGISAPQP